MDYVGDSTSEGLVAPSSLKTSQLLPAQMRKVGVRSFTPDIAGARSIVERFDGQPNGHDVVSNQVASGFDGCWVIALGTNDSATASLGGSMDDAGRIEDLMKLIGSRPVMWLTVKSIRTDGPYAAGNYQAWNNALAAAAKKHPNMRVYDWASEVNDSWFRSDGVHFLDPGMVVRSHRIAQALARAFPRHGHSRRELVRVS